MDTIVLERGGRQIILEKVPDQFGVRFNRQKSDARGGRLAAAARVLGERSINQLDHLGRTGRGAFELYSLRDPGELERTTDALRKSDETSVVTHVYTLGKGDTSPVVPTGTLTLQFEPDVPLERKVEVLSKHGLEVLRDLAYLPGGLAVSLTSASTQNPLKIALDLQKTEGVKIAEPDLAFRTQNQAVVDTLFSQQWHLKNPGGLVGLQAGADVNAEPAWQITKGSRDVTVCVMDDGFDLQHPDFSGVGKIVAPFDFGEGDAAPEPATAADRHGTACAGVAIAEENGSGVVGLAPRCAFMPIRTSGWLSDDDLEEMFLHAMDKGADVISCSWSAQSWDFPLSTRVNALLNHVATAGRGGKGCVILFAAGNEDRPLDGVKDGRRSVQGFALHPAVIAVAASNSLDRRSSYSNFGRQISICAPSSGSPGRGIVTVDNRDTSGYDAGDFTFTFGGTSSATPLAAGLAGLILSVNPQLRAAEVKQIMEQTSVKIDAANVQYEGGRSDQLGWGRIDAGAAVRRALGVDAGPERTLSVEHRVGKSIPDVAAINDSIEFSADVAIVRLEVKVEIRHSYVGDLRVLLRAPSGREFVLHDQSGGSADDLSLTVRSGPADHRFDELLGSSAKGRWTLVVSDHAEADVGALQVWGIAVTYRAAG